MKQTLSHIEEPFETMPFAGEIRASAKYSAELRHQADQLFELMREPLVSEAQSKALLDALQSLRSTSFSNPRSRGGDQKSAAAPGGVRRLPSSKLI